MAAWARKGLPSAVAFVVAAILFARLLAHGLLEWDDHLTLSGNPALNPPTLHGLLAGWTEPYLALWIPLTHTVWWLLARLGGADHAAVYHAASVVVHALASAVVARLAMLASEADGSARTSLLAGTVGGVLFAVHPAQVESVAWASGLKDLLAGLLGWAAVWVLAEGARSGAGVGWRRCCSAAGLLAGALLAKPSAVAFPVAGGVLLLWTYRMAWKPALLAVIGGLLLAAPVAVVAKAVQPPNDVFVPSVGQRVLVAGDALAFYCRHVVVPWPLAVDLARSPEMQLSQPLVGAMWAVPVCVLAAAWVLDRAGSRGDTARPGGAALGGVLAAMLLVAPVLGLVPFQFQRYSTVADHYLYSALGGVAVAVAVLLTRVARHGNLRPLVIAGSVLLLTTYAAISTATIGHWRDTRSLFEHNLRQVPDSFAAQRVLGFQAARRGDETSAEAHFRRALDLRPDDIETRYNLANLHLRRRDLELARDGYEQVLRDRPELEGALNNLAITYELLGQPSRAREVYQRLLDVAPGNDLARRGALRTTPPPASAPATAPAGTTRPGGQ